MMRSIRGFVQAGIPEDKIDERTDHIHSPSLRESVRLSLRTARFVYQINVALLSAGRLRKALSRVQLIEIGAACEGLLFDLVQSIGVQDRPVNVRPMTLNHNPIEWEQDGLLGSYTKHGSRRAHNVSFYWLISEVTRLSAVDQDLAARLQWLREARNVVHPTLSAPRLYHFDLDEAKEALEIFLATSDATRDFKKMNALHP
ncbi:MAG: hypothetical protein QM784_09655 [Polyangiaceae bacterium]